MKKYLLLLTLLALAIVANAEEVQSKKGFELKLYGQVRADLFYNTRVNAESVDGLFYSYPMDIKLDAEGNDLNDQDNSNMYLLYSRLGLDIKGPKLGSAKTSAKIEFDFRGSGTTLSLIRLRHAYFNFDWGKSSVLAGQTWHPFFGEVSPQMLNLNTGAPFQPFSRAPQVRYRFNHNGLQLTASAVWQSQFLSVGPDENDNTKSVKSNKYIKNSCIPEIHFGADYKTSNLIVGAGADMTSLVPRTQSTVDGNTYKVNERITTVSGEVHAKYTTPMWYFAAKSTLASNLTQTSMLGGYGVCDIDPITGQQSYTPTYNSSSWVNVVWGKKWKVGAFGGYMKNLGTTKEVSSLIGTGVDVDQIVCGSAEVTYNLPHWRIGLEYNYTAAWYGDLNKANGKIVNTHSVDNHRIVASASFSF
ncbi:MAG: hypothetical protein IKV83_02310 [Muribaculaceae bacterium]|nr:hypothetical protein [Muribaculaceae bacterium]